MAREAAPAWAATAPVERGELLFRVADLLATRRGELAGSSPAKRARRCRNPRRDRARRRRPALVRRRGLAADRRGPSRGRGAARCSLGARAARRGRRDHALELPVRDPDLEARSGAGLRQHGRAEALGADALVRRCWSRRWTTPALPAGVLNLVTGVASESATRMTGNPEVDAISFTGSLAVGRQHQGPRRASRREGAARDGRQEPGDRDGGRRPGARGRADRARRDVVDRPECTATSRAILLPGVAGRSRSGSSPPLEALAVGDPRTRRARSGRWPPSRSSSRCSATCEGGGHDGRRRRARGRRREVRARRPSTSGSTRTRGSARRRSSAPSLGLMRAGLRGGARSRQRGQLRALRLALHPRPRPGAEFVRGIGWGWSTSTPRRPAPSRRPRSAA